jgi:hypothetical protein
VRCPRRAAIAALAFALFVGAGTWPAHAADDDIGNKAYFSWRIESVSVPFGTEMSADKRKSFLTLKLLPVGVFQLPAPLSLNTNGLSLEGGTLLFAYQAKWPVVCTVFDDGAVSRALKAELGAGKVCFVDSNADGAFDEFFPSQMFLSGTNHIPKKRLPIKPFKMLRYSESISKPAAFLFFQYNGLRANGRKAMFRVCTMPDVSKSTESLPYLRPCLAGNLDVDMDGEQRTFGVLGGRFVVTSADVDHASIRQISEFADTAILIDD